MIYKHECLWAAHLLKGILYHTQSSIHPHVNRGITNIGKTDFWLVFHCGVRKTTCVEIQHLRFPGVTIRLTAYENELTELYHAIAACLKIMTRFV